MSHNLKTRIRALEKAAPSAKKSGAGLWKVIIYKMQKAAAGNDLPAENQNAGLQQKILSRLDAIRAAIYLPDNGRGG